MNILATVLLFLPLLSSSLCMFFRSPFGGRKSFIYSSIIIGISLFCSLLILYYVYHYGNISVVLGKWFVIDETLVNWTICFDPMSSMMSVVVCLVSWCVHIYSFEYMADSHFNQRFFSYLSLFTFFMLLLLVSGNVVQMFVGWEGVGLCSYLLISYITRVNSATIAGMKAFIINRVADIFLCLGIFIYYQNYGTFSFSTGINIDSLQIEQNIYYIFGNEIQANEIISMLFFIGAMGKSAQIFLHTWLPDAMEGPTPVSALIHAATMVTAGVIIVAKLSSIFAISTSASNFVTIIGISTSIFAGLVALYQDDIKKIIAYSTCSQLGYMFVLNGLGGYNFAIFHLFTHAMFKALLFLSAGAIIHTLSHEQNIFKIKKLGVGSAMIKVTMLIGCLAISGIPPFAGFYSKDAMLEYIYAKYLITNDSSFYIYYGLMLLIAGLTTMYTFRMFFIIFCKSDCSQDSNIRCLVKINYPIKFALIVLSVFSTIFGVIGSKVMNFDKSPQLGNMLPFYFDNTQVFDYMHNLDSEIKLLPVLVSILAILISYFLYRGRVANDLNFFSSILYNKFYFDEIYDILFVRNYKRICDCVNYIFELPIQSITVYSARFTSEISKMMKIFLFNNLSFYLFVMIFMIIAVVLIF